MSSEMKLNGVVVYDTEGDNGDNRGDGNNGGSHQIFRPTISGTDTIESRVITPESENDYYSVANRTTHVDRVNKELGADSLRSIIERLDQGPQIQTAPVDSVEQSESTYVHRATTNEAEIRSALTEEFNEVK